MPALYYHGQAKSRGNIRVLRWISLMAGALSITQGDEFIERIRRDKVNVDLLNRSFIYLLQGYFSPHRFFHNARHPEISLEQISPGFEEVWPRLDADWLQSGIQVEHFNPLEGLSKEQWILAAQTGQKALMRFAGPRRGRALDVAHNALDVMYHDAAYSCDVRGAVEDEVRELNELFGCAELPLFKADRIHHKDSVAWVEPVNKHHPMFFLYDYCEQRGLPLNIALTGHGGGHPEILSLIEEVALIYQAMGAPTDMSKMTEDQLDYWKEKLFSAAVLIDNSIPFRSELQYTSFLERIRLIGKGWGLDLSFVETSLYSAFRHSERADIHAFGEYRLGKNSFLYRTIIEGMDRQPPETQVKVAQAGTVDVLTRGELFKLYQGKLMFNFKLFPSSLCSGIAQYCLIHRLAVPEEVRTPQVQEVLDRYDITRKDQLALAITDLDKVGNMGGAKLVMHNEPHRIHNSRPEEVLKLNMNALLNVQAESIIFAARMTTLALGTKRCLSLPGRGKYRDGDNRFGIRESDIQRYFAAAHKKFPKTHGTPIAVGLKRDVAASAILSYLGAEVLIEAIEEIFRKGQQEGLDTSNTEGFLGALSKHLTPLLAPQVYLSGVQKYAFGSSLSTGRVPSRGGRWDHQKKPGETLAGRQIWLGRHS